MLTVHLFLARSVISSIRNSEMHFSYKLHSFFLTDTMRSLILIFTTVTLQYTHYGVNSLLNSALFAAVQSVYHSMWWEQPIAVKTLFDEMLWSGSVQQTSVICCICLPCRCVCFVFICLCLAGTFPVPFKRNIQISGNYKTETICGVPLPPCNQFFTKMHRTYSHMTWSSSCKAKTSFSIEKVMEAQQ